MLSYSYLPMVQKLNTNQHWMLYAAKNCASENDMETAYIPPPQMQAAMPQQGPEPPLFGHVVSDNVLLQWLGWSNRKQINEACQAYRIIPCPVSATRLSYYVQCMASGCGQRRTFVMTS